MESFHIFDSDNQNYQSSYDFNSADLADIPCPDDNCADAEGSPAGDDIELPLPPGTSRDEFPIPLPPKQEPSISNSFSPSLSQNKASENTSNHLFMTENCKIFALDDDTQNKPQQKIEEGDNGSKAAEFFDDSKYSPSKVDSDDENQDFISIKPKVLGKEQAKRRLMAFSLSKQPSSSVKKQNKAVTSKNKEKPPNPNKGSNVQEQFRATITAIEEEKKKMFQNMPSYLLLEMSELTKSHSSMSSSLQLLEKLKNENVDSKNKQSSSKNRGTSEEKAKSKRNSCRSRSRSPRGSQRNRKRRNSRSKRRSISRSKRSRSRGRRRSQSKGRSRRFREEKNFKSDNNKESVPKKKFEDWKGFKAAGFNFENDSRLSKNGVDDTKSRRDEHQRRSRTPREKTEFKPTFNYLTKGCNYMTSLQAKPALLSNSAPVLFSEKIIKYTRAKPILCWAENPNYATEYYMSRQMLLENCDQNTSSVLLSIIENKKGITLEKEDILETKLSKSRPWYPRESFLVPEVLNEVDSLEVNESHVATKSEISNRRSDEDQMETFENSKEINIGKEDSVKGRTSIDKTISLVNDSYLSDEEQVKEMTVGNVRVQLDLDSSSVKVRSKWDSDYEGENSEKESVLRKEKLQEKVSTQVPIEGVSSEPNGKLISDIVPPCQIKPVDSVEIKKQGFLDLVSHTESPSLDASDGTTGNLVSEYEEFLKMVSVDSVDNQNKDKEKSVPESKPKVEKIKAKKLEKSCEENSKADSPKLGITDWDQESDHEEKSASKKIQFNELHDEFSILAKDEKSDMKLEKSKKKPSKKKTEKLLKKRKLLKKSNKAKKKKYDESCSEESTSETYESDSESGSNESEPIKKKKKKKKTSKNKKKSKKDSSSESDSDSDNDKIKSKKSKKKRGASRKSSSSDNDEDDDDDDDDDNSGDSPNVENSLLKQLDFKKQLIMKKIEEIDYIGDKITRKKEKGSRGKKKEKETSDESESEKQIKLGKKKKTESKGDKKKSKNNSKKSKISGKSKKIKKSKSSSDSDSESSEESVKEKKTKKSGKRKRNFSDSSDSEGKRKKIKSKSSKKNLKKIKKTKKTSSSSDSDDSESSSKDKRKSKKKENKVKLGEKIDTALGFKQNLFDESNVKNEERSGWDSKKLWKKTEKKSKNKKEDDDWEASSTGKESGEEGKTGESSWDEDVSVREGKTHGSEDSLPKSDKQSNIVMPEKDLTENNSTNTYETNNQLASEALKTSLSNFSFNENSFCSFGQELSRDFFLTERSYSNSGNIINTDNLKNTLIEPRPFQSVNKDTEVKKPTDSELYSPGYSDSEVSETEMSKSLKGNYENGAREDVYDPLNCDSECSPDNNEIELSSIPLPRVSDILLPGELRNFENVTNASSFNSEGSVLKDLTHKETEFSTNQVPPLTSPLKSCFTVSDFTPVKTPQSPFSDEKNTPTKRQLMSVKGQQKLVSKAASVFQDESDEENIEPSTKEKTAENTQTEILTDSKDKSSNENQRSSGEKNYYLEEKDETKRRKKDSRDKSIEKEDRKRSRSRERKGSSKTHSKKSASPSKRKKSKTPESKREKREIRSDSFEIEPLKSAIDPSELSHLEQPIPVLTGLDTSSEGLWGRPLAPGSEFSHMTGNLIDHSESFDIYPSEESTFRNKNYEKDYISRERVSVEKSRDGKSRKDRRKSRSRSYSPRKKPKSKSPERRKSPKNRSPRRKSVSPKRRDKSPFSPRRRSPKRKSPSRGYKSSRSPDKRRKSDSRSPRKRRSSSSRRSRSVSPRKYRSPKHRNESPRRKDSPARGFSPDDLFSPRKDMGYSEPYPVGLQNRIPVIGTANDGIDMKLSPSALRSPYENSMGFPRHLADPSAAESEIYNSFYEGDYTEEFGVSGYPEEVGVNNLITVKNHDIEKVNSPERLSLDQRIELELGVPIAGSQTQGDQYQIPNQVCPPFQEINQSHFQNSYNCDNTGVGNDNFYQNQNVQMNSEFNGQYFNGHQQQPPPSYGPFQQYPGSQPVQNSVLQVGNIVEVVPTLQHAPPLPPVRAKAPQIMQVGNVLQVVPTQKATPPVSQSGSHNYGPSDESPMMKTQKATAVVAPSSIVPTPSPEVLLNPLIKAIQLEREKRRKEKEKRKAEREARRKARQLRREAKLMSVNEKLKKSVQNEGLMLGQEVEDDELLDGLDVPSPPVPVEIITVSSPSALPPAGKGILITAGFMPKPPSEKKEVKFADGVCPGEGTSTSGGEDVASPPPKPKLPKEKRFKKKKTKVKKKVKVQIIRQIIQEEDDDEDDLSPPPPPPGDPPPVFFARFPFAGDAQFPVYQTQTTTTTLTTVQYPAQPFE